MANKTREQLKTLFETGDTPTQQDFSDLIDSVKNIIDDPETILPIQTDNEGCTLKTNGLSAFWGKSTQSFYGRVLVDPYDINTQWQSYGSGSTTWSRTIPHNLGFVEVPMLFFSRNITPTSANQYNNMLFSLTLSLQETIDTPSLDIHVDSDSILFMVTSNTRPSYQFSFVLLSI